VVDFTGIRKKTPFLNKIGRDLTLLARKGKIDPVIGRKKEMRKICQILTMKRKNNPVLVGEAGVGKTAVVEGLALRLIREDVPEELKGLRIIEVSLAALISGTKYWGDFEERIMKLIGEAGQNKDLILFIDEIHTLIGAGSQNLDAANILKPALARGEIRCIGATTTAEYRKFIEKDAALERRFQPVYLEEPTKEETVRIIQGLKRTYETHHKIKISDEAINGAVNLSIRYLPDRKLPDKAIDLIDQAAAKKRLKSLILESEYLEKSTSEIAGNESDEIMEVIGEDIAQVVAEWTGIPADKLTGGETERLLKMEEILGQRVIGQEEAIKAIANTIRVARLGLGNPNHPIGIFLFLGPTGVGKTELARALAEFLFDSEKRMIRFDMSEYMEKHTVSRLIGAPPGYIGHEQEGELTGAVRTHPYSVILFDEIEKAHPDIYNLFLQVFDEGRLTDSKGRKVDFTNTIIIMTSNIGGNLIHKKGVGFLQSEEEADAEGRRERDMEEVNRVLSRGFRQEFLNRIDKVILFNHLGKGQIRLIIDKLITNVKERLSQKGWTLYISEEVYDLLMEQGYSEKYGVREMERVMQKMAVEPMAEELLKDKFKTGETLYLGIESGKIVIQTGNELKTR